MKTCAYVPIKLNNKRLPGKNVKPFSDGTPLCKLIFGALEATRNIDEKYCFCSDESIVGLLPERVMFLQRDKKLDENDVLCNDIIASFIEKTDPDIIVLTHATSPFITTEIIEKCVDKVLKGDYDSAFTVKKVQEFLWKDNKPLNFDATKTPRSQDLPVYYSETNGIFVFRRDIYEKTHRRVGLIPYLCEVNRVEAIDVNYPEDFLLADAVYMSGTSGK